MKTPLDDNLNKAYEVFKQDHGRLREKLAASLSGRSPSRVSWRRQFIGDKIMKSRITKIAAAAVITVAVLVGVHQFSGSIDGASVAWAKVVKIIEEMPAFKFREKRIMYCDGKELSFLTSEVVKYFSPEYGGREDMYNQHGFLLHQVYLLWAEKVSITVQPALKQYRLVEITDAEIELFKTALKQIIQPIKSGQYTKLGRKTIDEIEVEGIEIRDIEIPPIIPVELDNLVIQIWVDVHTSLIVRGEAEAVSNDKYITVFTGGKPVKIKGVSTEFQWDVELDASVFEPNIPDDYTLVSDETDSHDEGKFVIGLHAFAKVTAGKYPSRMNLLTIMNEACQAIKTESTDLEPSKKKEEKTREIIQLLRPSCLFYAELVKQAKDVAYYGDTVTAEDADAVLMRWKISDDEYRVIVGDLTTENVFAERLAELEKVQ